MIRNRPAGFGSHRGAHFRDATAFGTVLCVILVSLLAAVALVIVDVRVGDEPVQSATTAETAGA